MDTKLGFKEFLNSTNEGVDGQPDMLLRIVEFISGISDETDDDNTLYAIEDLYEQSLKVLESIDSELLSEDLYEDFFVLLEDIHEEDDIDEASGYKYRPKKVSHGRRRSKASRMTGSKKQEYLRRLKKNRRLYKTQYAKKLKRKKYMKRHKRTAGYKKTKRLYKSLHR